MILRKPYAILIKNFRLIHLVLSLLMIYLIYKTFGIYSFLNEYISGIPTTISNEVTKSLFGSLSVLISILIVIGSTTILALMKFKDKPVKLYIYNIISYILFVIYYIIASSIIKQLEVALVDIRTLKILSDLSFAAIIIEIVALVLSIIRSTGFDVKSFNFKKDLEDLNVETKDNEEFEVNTEVDTNLMKRRLNRTIRHFRYIRVENKFLFNLIFMFITFVIIIVLSINYFVINKKYKLNETLKTSSFLFNFEEGYVTKYDYNNNLINKDKELVIIKFKARTLYGEKQIKLGSLYLKIDNTNYYHTMNYQNENFDFGDTWTDQKINNNFKEYILTFEIPTSKENSKMTLKYADSLKTYDIIFKPISLNKKEQLSSVNYPDMMTFDNSIFENTSLKINNFEMADVFKFNYQSCLNDVCSSYYEYLRTSVDNGASYLLKLDGDFTFDEDIDKISSLYKFIKYFGKIIYIENDEAKEMNIEFRQVQPKKAKTDSTYIEITQSVYESERLALEFNIRGKVYTYNLK